MNCKKSQICIRLPQNDVEAIYGFVRQGIALNSADFVRQAIREKIVRDREQKEASQ